jgi:hypothetical protein
MALLETGLELGVHSPELRHFVFIVSRHKEPRELVRPTAQHGLGFPLNRQRNDRGRAAANAFPLMAKA